MAVNREVFSELFLVTSEQDYEKAALAIGGQEAEEIVIEDREIRRSLLRSAEATESGEDSSRYESVASLHQKVPDMWSWEYIGLYSQYASVGLLYGSTGTLIPFCVYNYDGAPNVCSNARNIVNFAWSFKLWFAMLTDSYRPFGMRRKPWMILGWTLTLVTLLVLAFCAESMDVSAWLITLLFTQCFVMLSDVPADGYCVELGQLESLEQRGQILATGQRIRFTFCIVAGVIQTFLLNGPDTNDPNCPTNFENCWAWGFTVNQYYACLFVIVFILTIPIFWLKELDNSRIPLHNWSHYFAGLWTTMQNLTTFYLLIFVMGACSLTNFTNNANITLQYYVIKLTNFQAGIDTITTYGALVLSIWIFQKYLINRNWRYTQYASTALAAALGLVWIAPYYDLGGTMDPWFTIFIDLDTYFVQGLSQVLYSMAVIELALPGQEATTYELIITVGNAALTLNGVISTQLLTPTNARSCEDDTCSSDTVDVTSVDAYNHSNGPERFTTYTIVLTIVSLSACAIFVQFLPSSKQECQTWKEEGERLGTSEMRGKVAIVMSSIIVLYGVAAAILLINVDTACQPVVGGEGC